MEENISVGVLLPLAMFLEMDPADCLPFQVHETRETGQGGVVGAHIEFLSIQVYLEVFHHLHNIQ